MKKAPKKPTIRRVMELQDLLLAFHAIDRKIFIPPSVDKAENDITHSFSLAMIVWFLSPHFPSLDASKMIQLCLAHDVIEIYAGDTFSYDSQAVSTQKKREELAFTRLSEEWADFPGLLGSIKEYESLLSEEAKFVYALDKLQPAIMEYLNEGRVWHKLGITFAKFVAEKEKKIPISPDVYDYYQELREILEGNLHLFPGNAS
jgi:putative hydrolase of HD superfamily